MSSTTSMSCDVQINACACTMSYCIISHAIHCIFMNHLRHSCKSHLATLINNYPRHAFATHWFFIADYSMKCDNIRVSELSHDGCLLEELHFVLFTQSFLEGFQCNLLVPPCTLFNITKLARSKVTYYAEIIIKN